MQITRVSVRGFMGLDSVDIKLGKINVFVGPNGAGKSSLIEAILLPVFGQSRRAPRKMDWPEMIRWPHRFAEIFLQYEDATQNGNISVTQEVSGKINPKSVSFPPPIRKPDLYDTVLLDPLAFFELPPKIKADLVGDVRLDPQKLAEGLKNRGVPDEGIQEVVKVITTYKLSGAEKVLVDRRLQAGRQAVDPGPEPKFYDSASNEWTVTENDLEEARKSVRGLEASIATRRGEISNLQRWLDLIRDTRRAIEEANAVLAAANVPDDFPRQSELALGESRLQDLKLQMDAARKNRDAAAVETCPTCGQPYSPEAREANKQIDDLKSAIEAEELPLFALRGEYSRWAARKQEVLAAQQKLTKAHELKIPDLPSMDDVTKALEVSNSTMAKCQTLVNDIQAHLAAKKMWASNSSAYAMAKTWRDIWDKAVAAVRDPTFKAEQAHDPLEKVRSRLVQTSKLMNFAVEVTDGLDVIVNNRPWWLLSASQKLRVSVLLADAFAFAGGCKLLVIDGVDALVGAAQVQLGAFLRHVQQDYDTILLALAGVTIPDLYKELELNANTPGYKPLAEWFWVDNNTTTYRKSL